MISILSHQSQRYGAHEQHDQDQQDRAGHVGAFGYGLGVNGRWYRSRHVFWVGFRMPSIVCTAVRKAAETLASAFNH